MARTRAARPQVRAPRRALTPGVITHPAHAGPHVSASAQPAPVIKWGTGSGRVTARPNTRGHPRAARSWERPGLSRASVQVCLHSGVVKELNYFGQPQLRCGWLSVWHPLPCRVAGSNTHSKLAIGLETQVSRHWGWGVQPRMLGFQPCSRRT